MRWRKLSRHARATARLWLSDERRFAFVNQRNGRTPAAIPCHPRQMTGLAHAPDSLSANATMHDEGWAGLWPLAGRAAAQAFYIAVTLFVFPNMQDRTETITVALIGLVFASLRASTLAGACTQRRVALLLENQIRSVRQAIAQEIHARTIS